MRIVEQIKNFFFYGWKLRKCVSWDGSSIYQVLELQLTRLKSGCYENGNHVWSPKSREYKAICEAIELCKTLPKEYDVNMSEYYDFLKYDFEELLCGNFKLIDKRSPQQKKWDKCAREKDDQVQKDRKERLFYLLNKWSDFWWS